MTHKFQAICLKNDYKYKGSHRRILQPNFLHGKTYDFMSENYSTNHIGLGSIIVLNERGEECALDEDYFKYHFLKL